MTTTKTVTATPSPTTAKMSTTTAPHHKKIRVLVLFDVGGRGDLSFNDMAWLGAERAAKDFNITVQFNKPPSVSAMVPFLEQYAKSHKYDLIVLIGFLWTTPLNQTASKFPYQKFALIDSTTGVFRPNEVDLLFKEQQTGALVGFLAAELAHEIMIKENKSGPIIIGTVMGMDIPPLWRFHIGYLWGAKLYQELTGIPVKVLWVYTGTFKDPKAGYTAAWKMLQQGALVLYQLAGATGIGVLNAVVDWNKKGYGKAFAIGEDASQEWYAPWYIPLSGAKRVDVAVYDAIKMVVTGHWKPGIYRLGLKEGAVGIWNLQGVKWFAELAYQYHKLPDHLTPDEVVQIVKKIREEYISQWAWCVVHNLEKAIINGQIQFINPKDHKQYEQIIKELEEGNLTAALKIFKLSSFKQLEEGCPPFSK
ncbi:MAG: BMP family ABC transporter substrate-binding protein [Crenarchaeota archaeon]|nr:BMP family ABC transporter substrate-binding protein [Thermoproteota archaeon]